MMSEELKIHQAKVEDLELIREILKESALWLRSTGSTQWSDVLEGRDNHNVPLAIQRGEVYYATIGDNPGGMFILWANQSDWDAGLWGQDSNEQWLYLHRLAIRRQFAGTELSSFLIQAAKEVSSNRRKKGIRLDCMAEKDYLNQFYLRVGFTLIQTVKEWDTGEQKTDFNLYQYSVNE